MTARERRRRKKNFRTTSNGNGGPKIGEIPQKKSPPRKQEDEKIVGPRTDRDRLTDHDLFILTTKLKKLGSAREPAEERLLAKLERWR